MTFTRRIALGSALMGFGGMLMTARGADATRPSYPATAEKPTTDVYHGTEVVDPYRWLENVDDSAVHDWAAAQTKLTRSVLDADPSRPALVKQLKTLYDYQTTSAPIV